jgi:hypothetical protein
MTNSINKIHGTVIHDARITEDMVAQLEVSSVTELELWPSEDETKDGWELSDIQKKALQVPGKSITLILHATPKSYEEEMVNAGGVLPEETERTIKGIIEIKDSNFGIVDGNDWYYLDVANSVLTLKAEGLKFTPNIELNEFYISELYGDSLLPSTIGTITYKTIDKRKLQYSAWYTKKDGTRVFCKNIDALEKCLNADETRLTDADFTKLVCPNGRIIKKVTDAGNEDISMLPQGLIRGTTSKYNWVLCNISTILPDEYKTSNQLTYIVDFIAGEEKKS